MLKNQIASLKDKFGGALLSGSLIMLISTTVVNAGNYLYNLILGRWLGPADFSDLSLIVTLMLMVTFITVTLQMTAAKFAAAYSADGDDNLSVALRQWLGKWAWGLGCVLGLLLALGAPLWQSFFRTSSPWPFVILGVGVPIYFAQGVDRGVLQGEIKFNQLAISYQAEMWARLVFGLILVALGFSVGGATVGITLSFIATWIVARAALRKNHEVVPTTAQPELPSEQRHAVAAFAWPVIIANVSQILINNSDILIVKRFFEAEEAGRYAALALIGRIVFFATWSVVVTLFPIVAQRHQKGEPHRQLLWAGLGMVAAASLVIVAFTVFVPEWIVNVLFGEAYLSVAPLLWLYAIATMLYSLANVVINYRLSADSQFGTYLAVVGGLAQVIGLWIFHASLRQVVIAQIIIMSGLLIALLIWDSLLAMRESAVVSATTGD